MPRYRGGIRQAGRRRPVQRNRAEGMWFGMGKQEEDGISGWLFPIRLMTRQRGVWISPRPKDESLDYPETY